jgi:uncharacterized protein (TIGR03435 family)
MVTNSLSSLLGRPVVNETGLDGPFDLRMQWTPESTGPMAGAPPPGEPVPTANAEGPSIFTALTEQLGLRVESKKGPVGVFVIEKIEKPSEN